MSLVSDCLKLHHDWNEDQPRDEAGRFAGEGGGKPSKDAFGQFSSYHSGPSTKDADKSIEHKKFESAAMRYQKLAANFRASGESDDRSEFEAARDAFIRARDAVDARVRWSDNAQEHYQKIAEFHGRTIKEAEDRRAAYLENRSKEIATAQRENRIRDYEKFVKATGGSWEDYTSRHRV